MDKQQTVQKVIDNLDSAASYGIGIGAITFSQFVDFASDALQFLTLLGGCVVVWHRFYMDRKKAKRFLKGGDAANDE